MSEWHVVNMCVLQAVDMSSDSFQIKYLQASHFFFSIYHVIDRIFKQ